MRGPTLAVRLAFFVGAMVSLYFSQEEYVPFSWAMFLCFLSAICIIGVFYYDDDRPAA